MNQKILNHHFNRKTPLEYAIWFAELQGIEIDLDLDYSKNRGLIEGQVIGQIPQEVFKATSKEGVIDEEESSSDNKESGEISDGEEVTEVSKEAEGIGGEEAPSEDLTSEDIGNSEDFPSSLSYDAMTVKELKAECKSRGLPIYGTKAELALRLKRDDEGISESTTETETPAEAAVEEKSDIPADEAAMTNGETNENSGE